MKLEKSFQNFLENEVNLNQSRVNIAKDSVDVMKKVIQNSSIFSDHFIDLVPQGSFRQETIIKPSRQGIDFDVDLLLEMNPVEGWEPEDYLYGLGAEFRSRDRYKNLVDTRGKERCVTIDYESDFHVDLVPAIKDGSSFKIMNKATNAFELSDGDGYAEWFQLQNDLTGNKYLTKVTRLFKFIRDNRKKFEIKSILLTTLLGNQVSSSDNKAVHYPDLPTSFITLITRLNIFLQNSPIMPLVINPALPSENFNRKWSQEMYEKFRTAVYDLTQIAIDAYRDPNESSSILKWQKIFGYSFTAESPADTDEDSLTMLGDYSHRQSPFWPKNIGGQVKITKCDVRGNNLSISLKSNGWPIEDGCDLLYFAETTISKPYDVWWQVVNTGYEAQEEGGLRGNFEHPKDPLYPLQQKESSKYTGKHWIQCFIVKNDILVAESDPFYINVVKKNRKRFKVVK